MLKMLKGRSWERVLFLLGSILFVFNIIVMFIFFLVPSHQVLSSVYPTQSLKPCKTPFFFFFVLPLLKVEECTTLCLFSCLLGGGEPKEETKRKKKKYHRCFPRGLFWSPRFMRVTFFVD